MASGFVSHFFSLSHTHRPPTPTSLSLSLPSCLSLSLSLSLSLFLVLFVEQRNHQRGEYLKYLAKRTPTTVIAFKTLFFAIVLRKCRQTTQSKMSRNNSQNMILGFKLSWWKRKHLKLVKALAHRHFAHPLRICADRSHGNVSHWIIIIRLAHIEHFDNNPNFNPFRRMAMR